MNEEKYYNQFIKRLQAKTKYIGDCWIFMGSRSRDGYGLISYNNKTVRVNKIVCSKTYNKDLNDGTWMSCHEPICTSRACWNPAHLRPDTHANNMKDAVKTGIKHTSNHNTKKTHCKNGHPYDMVNNYGARRCKRCYTEVMKKIQERYNERKKLRNV